MRAADSKYRHESFLRAGNVLLLNKEAPCFVLLSGFEAPE